MHNILDTAFAAGNVKASAAALTTAGLGHVQIGTQPVTLFATTDAAFATDV